MRSKATTKRRPWVVNQATDSSVAEILIFDIIDPVWGIGAKEFADDLRSLGNVDEILVHLSSPGGDVFDGITIHNLLKRHPAKINVLIDVALSMASGIAMAGDSVEMANNGLFMLHEPSTFAAGGAEDMKRVASRLEVAKKSLASAYAEKTGKPIEEINDMMAAETWLSADDAYDLGFVDVVGEEVKIAASFDKLSIANLPDRLRKPFDHLFCISDRENPMSTTADNAASGAIDTPQPATIQDLEGLHGATPDFILDCIRSGSTIVEATNKLNETLANRNRELQQQADDAAAAAASQTTPPGNDGIDTSANAGDDEGDSRYGADPMVFFAEAMEKMKAQYPNTPPGSLMGRIHAKYPGLLQSLQEYPNPE
jgi:ATP-dependent protease ClpP protease subunit